MVPSEMQYHLIAKWASHYRIPVPLVLSICEHESDFDSSVMGSAGELGIMQVLERGAFADMVGEFTEPHIFEGMIDDDLCLKFGVGYLRLLINRYQIGGTKDFGEMTLLLIGYNAGPGRALQKPAPPLESLTYAYEILSRYAHWHAEYEKHRYDLEG